MFLKYFTILICATSWSIAQHFTKIWETAIHPATIYSGTLTVNGNDYFFAQNHWQLSLYQTKGNNNVKLIIDIDSAKHEYLYTVIPDVSGNGSDELWFEQSFHSDYGYRKGVRIVDGETGATIIEKNDPAKNYFYPLEFGAGVHWKSLSPVGDFNGDDTVELLIATGNYGFATDSSILIGYHLPVSDLSSQWSTAEYRGSRHGIFFLRHSGSMSPYFYVFIDPVEMVVMQYPASQTSLYTVRYNDTLPPPDIRFGRVLRVVSDVSGDTLDDLFFDHALFIINGGNGTPVYAIPRDNDDGMVYSYFTVEDVEYDGTNEIVRIDDNIILDEQGKFAFGPSTSRLTLYETTGRTSQTMTPPSAQKPGVVVHRHGKKTREAQRGEEYRRSVPSSISGGYSGSMFTPSVKWQSPVFAGGASTYLDPIHSPSGVIKTLTVSDTGIIRIMNNAMSASPRLSIPLSYDDGELIPNQYPVSAWHPLLDINGDGYGDINIIREKGFRIVDGVTGKHLVDAGLLGNSLVDAWIFYEGDILQNNRSDLGFYAIYDIDGQRSVKLVVYETGGIITTVNKPVEGKVAHFDLKQNYPNPFNPVTELKFTIPSDGVVSLRVYNMLGQQVAALVNGNREGGKVHSVRFNGSTLSSGVYLSVLEHNGMRSSVKMLLLK